MQGAGPALAAELEPQIWEATLGNPLFLGELVVEVGDLPAADANIDALDAESRATGQARYAWQAPLLRAMRAAQEGRFADADALAAEAAELGAVPAAQSALFLHRFARLRNMERGPETLALEPRLLLAVARWNDAAAYADLMAATVRAVAGDAEGARRHLARIGLDSIPARVRVALGALAAATIQAGAPTHAAELYDRLTPKEGLWHVFMMGGFAVGGTYSRYTFATPIACNTNAWSIPGVYPGTYRVEVSGEYVSGYVAGSKLPATAQIVDGALVVSGPRAVAYDVKTVALSGAVTLNGSAAHARVPVRDAHRVQLRRAHRRGRSGRVQAAPRRSLR